MKGKRCGRLGGLEIPLVMTVRTKNGGVRYAYSE
jgi:hypothetical protein